MDTKTYLDGEIARLYEKMSALDPISEEYGTLEARWNELMVQRLELEKHESSLKENRKDRGSRIATECLKTAVPVVTSVVMSLLVLTCEAKGVVPFGIGKKWIDKITKF